MDLIKLYGDIVTKNIEQKPKKTYKLLKKGYKIQRTLLEKLPDKTLPKSQQYLSKKCTDFILNAMIKPEKSVLVNLFAPCEFIHAMSLYPQFVEAFSSYLSGAKCEKGFIEFAEKKGVPETFCSYHKALIGAMESGVLPKPVAAIATTLACDANLNTVRRASKYYDIDKYIIDVPYDYSEYCVQYVSDQLKEMVVFLEDHVGKRLDDERLIEVIRRENESIDYYNKFLNELSYKFFPNTLTLEMYRIFMSHVAMGTEEALKYYKLLYKDIQGYTESKGIRIIWGHLIPFYQQSLREYFNNNKKYQLLICDLNFDSIMKIDEKHPYESIARKLILNKFNGNFHRRVDTMLKMSKKLNAQGVINLCHWGCKQSSGGAFILKKELEKKNIPTLIIDGDGVDRRNINDGQIRTRVAAFMEILQGKEGDKI